jgi:hypothetical protein
MKAALCIAFLVALAVTLHAQDKPADTDIDWTRARQLYQREQRGEKLGDEEQAYLDKAKAARRAQGGQGRAANPGAARLEPQDSTGLVPLTQLKGEYKGQSGGLYGNGKNEPPAKLLDAAKKAQPTPLDSDGKPAKGGKIVLMSIGMSNTTQEFSRFKQIADEDDAKAANVVIVDGAQGGQDALKWDVPADKGPWTQADQRLQRAGVSAEQVQVLWIKQALAGQGHYGEFPAHADAMKKHVESCIEIAAKHYPNLKLVFLSSRIYGGYAGGALNPEPYAYEGAFAMRGVIDDELKGDLKPPVVLWGPYLWADGVKGRDMDKLVYTREDLGPDGTHPSASGRQKVADQLLQFFKTDPTAKGWFVK